LWLAAPVLATLFGAAVLWWRGRPSRTATALTTPRSISGHQAYLEALRTRRPVGAVASREAHDSPG